MIKQFAAASLLILTAGSTAFSAECGEPPLDKPRIPDGNRATADTIADARDRVIAFSSDVDRYLACMDDRSTLLFTYMTEEQRTRWTNDLADIHETRRQLQLDMNSQIRAFRSASSR